MSFAPSNFVPCEADERAAETLVEKRFAAREAHRLMRTPSYSVRDEHRRISCRWGLSSAEVTLLRASMRFLNRSGRRCLWAILGDELLDLPPSEAWDRWHDFKRRVTRDMKRAGEPPWWVAVAEATGGVHFNMVFPAPPGFDDRMRGWVPFQAYLQGERAVVWVDAAEGGFRGLTSYLAAERSPQAEWWHGRDLGPRLKGSHRIGDPVIDAADRVMVSRALGAALIRDGAVKPFQRTTRKNRVAALSAPIAEPATMTTASSPLPEEIEAVAAPLPAVAPAVAPAAPPEVDSPPPEAGSTVSPEIAMAVPPPEPVQLLLFDALPEREHLGEGLRDARRRLGLSQAAAGRLVGIRQPHMSNAEAGRHPIARSRVRALQFLAQRNAA